MRLVFLFIAQKEAYSLKRTNGNENSTMILADVQSLVKFSETSRNLYSPGQKQHVYSLSMTHMEDISIIPGVSDITKVSGMPVRTFYSIY